MEEILATLAAHNHAQALAVAQLPEQIKGFGHVKERNIASARVKWNEGMVAFRAA
jgi:indolepyruvate ferredoxin oxidoreductase